MQSTVVDLASKYVTHADPGATYTLMVSRSNLDSGGGSMSNLDLGGGVHGQPRPWGECSLSLVRGFGAKFQALLQRLVCILLSSLLDWQWLLVPKPAVRTALD